MTRIRGDVTKIKDTQQPNPGTLVNTPVSGSISKTLTGTVGGLPATRIDFVFTGNGVKSTSVYVENTSTVLTERLFVSRDEGATYKELVAGANWSEDVQLTHLYLYSNAVAVPYEINYPYVA